MSDPFAGLVSTREAARIYGCTEHHLRQWVPPFAPPRRDARGHLWWHPQAVLKARAAITQRIKHNAAYKSIARTPEAKRRGILAMQATRLERLRLYYQAKARSRAAA